MTCVYNTTWQDWWCRKGRKHAHTIKNKVNKSAVYCCHWRLNSARVLTNYKGTWSSDTFITWENCIIKSCSLQDAWYCFHLNHHRSGQHSCHWVVDKSTGLLIWFCYILAKFIIQPTTAISSIAMQPLHQINYCNNQGWTFSILTP